MTNSKEIFRRSVGILLVAATIAACAPQSEYDFADLALQGGTVYTMDSARSWAQAVAIRNGRIVFVGTDRNFQARVGPATRVIDLKGRLIDAVVSDRPVYVASADGHTVWVNGKALKIAGITNETPDPPDGRIDRDRDGAAIGSLQEGAGSLVPEPPATDAQRHNGLRHAIKLLNGYGITSVQDASVVEAELRAYNTLDASGELSLRVVASILWDHDQGLGQVAEIVRLRKQYASGHVDAGTVKIFVDGVMEHYTAAMLEPYLLPGNVRGIPMIEPERMKEVVTHLDGKGFQVHFHAIGDVAVRSAFDAVEDEYIIELTIPFLGTKRSADLYPIGSVYRSGAVIAFGSDWSVSSATPFEQIETAVTRMGALGETDTPFLPTERINLPEAIAAFTINAAYANRSDKQTGSVEVGKLAGLVVLDQNHFAIPPGGISETQALVTLFEGKTVHGDLGKLR